MFRSASRAAHIINIPPTIYAPLTKLRYSRIIIEIENSSPSIAANLLGGAKIGLGVKLKVFEITFAFRVNNEGIFVKDRRKKSTTKKSAITFQLVNSISNVRNTTCPAVIRTIFSFT